MVRFGVERLLDVSLADADATMSLVVSRIWHVFGALRPISSVASNALETDQRKKFEEHEAMGKKERGNGVEKTWESETSGLTPITSIAQTQHDNGFKPL